MRIGSLFSGIGGLELGLEWSGLGRVVWQCEVDPFCRRVLAKHWPNVTRYEDVRGLVPPEVDVLCGGFPCQDVSSGNRRAKGLAGERSGLWREYARIVEAIRPRIVIVENVASGARRWLPHVRRDLHLLGYRTRAYALSAADVGALHLRRRVFVVAHADRQGEHAQPVDAEVGRAPEAIAHADGQGEPSWAGGRFAQPDVVRVLHGLPRGVDGARRKALGNSVVPQCAEVIGNIIKDCLETS